MEIDTILRNFIAGEWVEEAASMPAVNPATGERIARLPRSSRETAERAVAAARRAQAAWDTCTDDSGGGNRTHACHR
jgi:acyl-CoA reductase-like NAD-dependent aldehyde dehydrogenase